MPKTKKEIKEMFMRRAEKGAARMDRCLPGWYRQIDRSRLNLEYYNDCILGQCFDRYLRGSAVLGLVNDAEIHQGFLLYETESENYPLLTACWKTLINQRLANDEQKTRTAALPTPPKNARQRKHPTTTAV